LWGRSDDYKHPLGFPQGHGPVPLAPALVVKAELGAGPHVPPDPGAGQDLRGPLGCAAEHPAAESLAVEGGRGQVSPEDPADHVVDPGKGHDVHHVVVENDRERSRPGCAEKLQPDQGDVLVRDVQLPGELEDLRLDAL
jgi:hypothetical protein